MSDVGPSPVNSAMAPSGLQGILHNGPFIAAFTAFVIAQVLKVFTFWYSERRWDFSRIVVGLTAATGVLRGTDSHLFAFGLVFCAVVMYDASGVRLHAGKQASVLNMIITELPPEHPVSDTRPLRDSLGHTPLQVAVGAMIGVVVGYVIGLAFL